MPTFRPWTTALVGLLICGCATAVRAPNVAPVSAGEARDAWAQVLLDSVDERGQIDFAGLARQPEALEHWVAYIATVSPKTDPDRYPTVNDRLAYYIDAYNALAMYGVFNSGVLPEQKIRFFLLRRYTIGGERMSLYTLENDVIRAYREPRIHFALNCMSFSCPRLPRETWQGATLDAQLQAAAVEFFASERHLRVDDDARTAQLSEILQFYEEDFVAEGTSLIDYVNRYRSPPIPADYSIDFIPYDWSLNQQPL